jgi:crossover junction endodeoxyribonuclease RuvC
LISTKKKFKPLSAVRSVCAFASFGKHHIRKHWLVRLTRFTLPTMRAEVRKPFALRVLGIDPAAAGATGFAIVDAAGSCSTSIHFDIIAAAPRSASANVPARLQLIHKKIAALIEQFSPQCLAIESIFTALNVKTALRLAEVRGVILLAAAQRNLPVHSYSPREVKAAVAGYGHADKAQMQQMVRAILSLKEIPQPSDAADALAVALCHIQFAQSQERFGIAAHLLAAPRAARRNSPALARIVSVR